MFPLLHANKVVVEEVDIQTSLEDAREYLRPAVEVVEVVPVYPVENVEEPVEAECCHVVRGNILNQSDLVQHHYLRDECDRLQPQTVAPDKLPGRPPAINNQCQHEGSWDQDLKVGEIIAQCVISLSKVIKIIAYCAVGLLISHEVDDEGGGGNEEYFHECVVQGDEVHEEVQVPHTEYQ